LAGVGTSTVSGVPIPTYRYRDSSHAHGPCGTAQIKHGKTLKLSYKTTVAPIDFTLDEPTQGSLAVAVRSGGLEYCATFGGSVVVDSGVQRRFLAKNAPATVGCLVPPTSCP
jgi:hypothetical protein